MANYSLVIVLVALVGISQGYIQEFVLHDNATQDGSYFLFRRAVPDLITCFAGHASYCTRGFWLAYPDTKFEGPATNLHGFNESLLCIDETFPYKSIRHGGPLDTSMAGISVYPEEGYQGVETLITGRASALLQAKSLLYSLAAEWTLYSEQDFKGNFTCTTFNVDYTELGIYGHVNVTNTIGYEQIGSVLQGCDPVERQKSMDEYYAQLNN